MKKIRLISVGLVLATFSPVLFPVRLAAAAAKEEVLIDLTDVRKDPLHNEVTKNYEYTYGSWSGKVSDLSGRGALIQAPSGQGGLGENKTSVSFKDSPTVEVVFIIGNANQAAAMNFALEDKDGTECSWAIPIGQLGRNREQHFSVDLKNPSAVSKPGKTPGLNLARITTWQIRGDWTESRIEVLLIKIVVPK